MENISINVPNKICTQRLTMIISLSKKQISKPCVVMLLHIITLNYDKQHLILLSRKHWKLTSTYGNGLH